MKVFTTKGNKILSIVLFLMFWEVMAKIIGEALFLPSPIQVFLKFLSFFSDRSFYKIIAVSSGKIVLAFLLSVVMGLFFSIVANYSKTFEILINPYMLIFKSVPVVAFIVLALLWVNTAYLSVFIVFVVNVPIIYTNALKGMKSADEKLLEMAKVYNFNYRKKLKYIYFPAMGSALLAGLKLSIGIAFKSGVAAEVIGMPKPSIGNALMDAKVYLETEEMFAWTIAILILSALFERLVVSLYHGIYRSKRDEY